MYENLPLSVVVVIAVVVVAAVVVVVVSAAQIELTAVTAPKFRSFYPLESSGLKQKRPDTARFSAKKLFSPADEFVITGLVVQSCYFDVTACAEARRQAQKSNSR